ncbi:hypothetical protein CMK19_00565 [Candidatus Poribacteria bacterium]|nr:hypothetical protein [Candidatus Poribacteria bacterium]
MDKKLTCEILLDLELEINQDSNTDQVVEEIHQHIKLLIDGQHQHYKGIDINGDYNIIMKKSENQLDLSNDDMIEV